MVLCLFPHPLILHDTFDLQLPVWWVFDRHLKLSPLRFIVLDLSCTDMFFKFWQSETLWLLFHSQHLTHFFDSAFLFSLVSVVIAKFLSIMFFWESMIFVFCCFLMVFIDLLFHFNLGFDNQGKRVIHITYSFSQSFLKYLYVHFSLIVVDYLSITVKFMSKVFWKTPDSLGYILHGF